jgi:hypothetical protein
LGEVATAESVHLEESQDDGLARRAGKGGGAGRLDAHGLPPQLAVHEDAEAEPQALLVAGVDPQRGDGQHAVRDHDVDLAVGLVPPRAAVAIVVELGGRLLEQLPRLLVGEDLEPVRGEVLGDGGVPLQRPPVLRLAEQLEMPKERAHRDAAHVERRQPGVAGDDVDAEPLGALAQGAERRVLRDGRDAVQLFEGGLRIRAVQARERHQDLGALLVDVLRTEGRRDLPEHPRVPLQELRHQLDVHGVDELLVQEPLHVLVHGRYLQGMVRVAAWSGKGSEVVARGNRFRARHPLSG